MARSKKTDTASSPDALAPDDAASAAPGAGRDPGASPPLEEGTGFSEYGEPLEQDPATAAAGTDAAASDTPLPASSATVPADEVAAEPAPAGERPAIVSPPPPVRDHGGSGGGFVAGLLGAALAIALGIGALWLSNPDLLRGEAPAPDLSPLDRRIEAQAAEIARLNEGLARLSDAPAASDGEDLAAFAATLTGRLDELDDRIASVSDTLDMLRGRVADLEARPSATAAADEVVAGMRAEFDRRQAELQAIVDEARAGIESAGAEARALQQDAQDSARIAVARAALARLQAALETGGPFAAALSDLSQSTSAQISAPLIEHADTGVATLADLRTNFPEAARAALVASVRDGLPQDAGAMARIGAFLRAQTGARSTTPREGGDPDAILSRAEAALAAGDLAAALSVIGTLPEAGRAEMSGWRGAAQARVAALEAAADVAAALPAN